MSEQDTRGRELVDRYYELMTANDDDGVGALYAEDAMVIRFSGFVEGRSGIVDYLRGMRAEHRPFDLHSIDRVRAADDVVMWDALVTTDVGVLATTDVAVLDEDGLIERHILGNRGYWGR
ncbi:MAG: nuclear transport factor 2 family protein [Actinomycetota bacterium]